MPEKILLDALAKYKIYLQIGNITNTEEEIQRTVKRIESYEEYLNQGNRITDLWLKENCTILAKVVKCAYSNSNEDSIDKENLEYLNKFMTYYRNLYKQCGFNFNELPILP